MEDRSLFGVPDTVNAVIINNEGNILCVSRKTNHSDFGLPGGKVDPEDYDKGEYYLEHAISREVLEETGLIVSNIRLIFAMGKYDCMGYTYLCEYKGEINYDEPHVVKWGTGQDLLDGCFGKYNKLVIETLKNLKIKHL